MPQIIDSLIVELKLDPAQYKKGLSETLSATEQGKEQIVKGTDEVERHTKGAAESFSVLRNSLLGVAAIFTAGLGLKEFIKQTVEVDRAIGRVGTITGEATETISKFRSAGLIAGGTGDSFINVIRTINSEIAKLQVTGSSDVFPFFRALGIDPGQNLEHLKKGSELLLQIGDATHDAIEAGKIDAAQADFYLKRFGFDDAGVAAIIRSKDALRQYIAAAERAGLVTEADRKAADALNSSWNELYLSASSLGRSILTNLEPALTGILHRAALLFQAHRQGKELTADFIAANPVLGPNGDNSSDLRAKPGSGARSAAVDALARTIQAGEPGLNRFTAFNDAYHAGVGAHGRGEALDFTVNDPSKSAEVAARLRARLAAQGVDAKVIDEYANPSANASGGHIHVQFSGAAAAAKFASSGAATSEAISAAGRGSSSTSTSAVNIGTLVVNSGAADAAGIAHDIRSEIQNTSYAVHANGGQQ